MFVHLHNHSEYSLLNGAIRLPELIHRAKQFDMPAVALTDYGNIFGAVDFFLEAKKANIKPIIGAVVFHPSNDQHDLRSHRRGIDHLFHLVLLIQNRKGYQNLCELMTRSYLEGFYYKPRIDSSLLKKYNEGLMALSAGWSGAINHYLFEGQKEKARERLKAYAEIFPGRFYLELQENGVEGQHEMNGKLLQLAQAENIPVVATNNCHYLTRDDAESFEALLCIQLGATLHGTNDRLKFSTDGYYFKSPDEMAQEFAYAPEALKATLEIADSCSFKFDVKSYHFPRFDPPDEKSLDDFLKEEAERGLLDRWPEIERNSGKKREGLEEVYKNRLGEELKIIQKMGFSGYFLIVSDFIRYAKNRGIPVGPGRGSAAGSLVAYCTQITDIDPLPYHLLFERFLNPERVSMPDVDIDFCMYGRDEVLRYVAKKFGNVSQIITFGKMKAKAVIRDVGRVMEIPYDEVDKIAKLVPATLNITLDEAIRQETRLKELVEKNPQITRLMQVARKLEGLNRHASTHAAGVVISDRPLTDFCPLYKGSNGDVVTQFDMKAVEKIGLIKFDFLGLKTLTVIQDTLKILKRSRGIDLNILDISLDDGAIYELLSRGDTAGVFQLESSGMKDLMIRLKPSCFEDLIALVALYRPGPLGSGMVDDFINRKHGKTSIRYDLPQLKPILEETYGVIVYQEQVMQIASVLAGYSLGEADILRRAMGKKKPAEMAAQRLRFLQGCLEKNIPRARTERIFDLMAKFAEYGFNKSHSVAYALVSFQTTYLKAHYMVEYLAALLTTEMHDTDRILYYIQDCQAHKIEVLPPDINESLYGFSVVGKNQIRYGLGALKNVGEGALEAIVEARKNAGGRFKSFFHFCDAVEHKRINRRVLEALIKCGAFDTIEKNRKVLFSTIDQAVGLSVRKQQEEGVGQTNLFSLLTSYGDQPVGFCLPQIPEWAENERLVYEKEALGFYFSGHPLKSYEKEIRRISTTDTSLCSSLPNQMEVTLVGMMVKSRVITTKKGARMGFLLFEDLRGNIEVVVFSDLYQQVGDLISQEKPIVLKGTIDRNNEGVKMIAREMVLLSEYLNCKTKSVHFKIPVPLFTEERLNHLHQILDEFSGNCRGYLHLIHPGEAETVMELHRGLRLDDSNALTTRVNELFNQKVVEYSV